MASVIINVLRKKKGHTTSTRDVNNDDPVSERRQAAVTAANILRQGSVANEVVAADGGGPTTTKSSRVAREEKAARTIQRTFRGHLLRQQLRGLVHERNISNQSLIDALEIVAKWHLGWSRFVLQLIVGAFLCITVYFQTFYNAPAAFDVNGGLIDIVASQQDVIQSVHEPLEVFSFLQAIVPMFYEAELVQSEFCKTLLEDYCALDSSVNDTRYETTLAINCTRSDDVDGNAHLDFAENTNKLLGASFVTQTRKQTTPCKLRLLPSKDSPRSSRLCLDESAEATRFQSDCSVNNQGQTAVCPQENDMGEFTYREDEGYFLFALHAGDIQGLPHEAIECKIERMKRLGWLDYRTKQVCLVFGFYNKQDQGRMMSYKECFRFMNGGKVNNYRVVSSTPLFADPTIPLVFTWILIGLILGKQLFDLIIFLQERRAIRKGTQMREWHGRRWTLRSLAGLVPSLIILAACIVFLVLVYNVAASRDAAIESQSLETFISTLSQADWAVRLWIAYTTITAIGLLIMLCKTLLLLDFHPTSAIVSGTLRRASSGLGCFFLIFLIVLLSYAYVGMILLGRSRYEFSAFGLALNTLLFVAVGEMQLVQDLIFYDRADEEYVTVIQAIFFWSYVLLVTILLMNVLLSIIVGAFVDLQEKSEKQLESKPIHSFTRSFCTSFRFWFGGFRVYAQRWKLWVRYRHQVYRFNRSRGIGICCCGGKNSTNPLDDSSTSPDSSADSNKGAIPMPPSYPNTPWQALIQFPKQYSHDSQGGLISTSTARKRLYRVFRNEQSVELIIFWCRSKTRLDRMEPFGYHLRGIDPDSDVYKGRTVFLLESIMKGMGTSNNGNGMRMASNKSLVSSNSSQRSDSNPFESQESRQRMGMRNWFARHHGPIKEEEEDEFESFNRGEEEASPDHEDESSPSITTNHLPATNSKSHD